MSQRANPTNSSASAFLPVRVLPISPTAPVKTTSSQPVAMPRAESSAIRTAAASTAFTPPALSAGARALAAWLAGSSAIRSSRTAGMKPVFPAATPPAGSWATAAAIRIVITAQTLEVAVSPAPPAGQSKTATISARLKATAVRINS